MTGTHFSITRSPAVVICVSCLGLGSGAVSASDGAEAGVAKVDEYLTLAETQLEDGLVLDGAANLAKAFEVLRETGPFQEPADLIDAYVRMGDIYQRRGDHERALNAYAEARTITRRAFGLSDVAEVEILRRTADSLVAIGQPDAAIALQHEANGTLARAYGRRSVHALEANLYLADWLSEHGMPGHAAQQYSLAARVLRSIPDHDPLEVIGLYRKSSAHSFTASAQAYRKDLGRPGQLIEALNIVQPDLIEPPMQVRYTGLGDDVEAPAYGCFDVDAEAIRQGQLSEPLLVAELLRDIGDWCMGLGIAQYFENAHVLAWELLGLVENGDQVRAEWFGAPVAIYTPKLEARALSDREDAPAGRVELSFIVDEDGSAGRIEVVSADPEGILDRWAVRRVRQSKFRPRMEDGRFVSARTTMVADFRYDAH